MLLAALTSFFSEIPVISLAIAPIPIITPVRKNTVSLTTNISNIKRILLLRFTVIIP